MSAIVEEMLFDELPVQIAPDKPFEMKPRLRIAERRQVELRAVTLDDLIPEDHRARFVWRFVAGLNLDAFLGQIKAVEGKPGHPPADPHILVALWLFATIEGVTSSRELAQLCIEHNAYRWLCGGVGMNAKTLADFRVGHGPVLETLLIDSFTALVEAGVASLEEIAQDGVRVRASAGAASFRRYSTLQECREDVERTLRELYDEKPDPDPEKRRRQAAQRRGAEDRELRVQDALQIAEKLQEEYQEKVRKAAEQAAKAAEDGKTNEDKPTKQEALKEPRVSTTDADARVMKMADGGFRPAFNVQFASDTKSGAIAAVSVDNIGSDMGKMVPMSETLEDDYGQRPERHLADGGYAKIKDIDTLSRLGVETFVPVPKPKNAERDRYVQQPGDAPGVAAWRERMGTEDAKETYKKRAATAECSNAQARNRGMTQFVVRGLEKIKAAALWFALAHNMACTWRLVWA